MPVKLGGLDIFNEIVNNRINIQTVLDVLARKGLLTQEEFDKLKKETAEQFKKDHPEIFRGGSGPEQTKSNG